MRFAIEHRAFRSMFGSCVSWSAFFALHTRLQTLGHACLYEIVRRDEACQFFLDLEGKGADRLAMDERLRILRASLDAFAAIRSLDFHGPSLRTFTADGDGRDSLHVIGGCSFDTLADLQYWGLQYRQFLVSQADVHPTWGVFARQVDTTVWRSDNRQWRCPGHVKIDDITKPYRSLQPCGGHLGEPFSEDGWLNCKVQVVGSAFPRWPHRPFLDPPRLRAPQPRATARAHGQQPAGQRLDSLQAGSQGGAPPGMLALPAPPWN